MRKARTEADILRKAAFAPLGGRALTREAKKLVSETNTRVVAQVTTLDESKPGVIKTNRNKLNTATEVFVADLLTAHSGKHPRRWVYRAMTARGFTGAPVGYRVFLPLQDALRALGLIEHRPGAAQWVQGFNQEMAPGQKTIVANRWAARFCATPELLSISKRLHVLPGRSLICTGLGASNIVFSGTCNPDFNIAQVGFVTRWTPVKNLTFSGEVLWTNLDQKNTGTISAGNCRGFFFAPSASCDPEGGVRLRNSFVKNIIY